MNEVTVFENKNITTNPMLKRANPVRGAAFRELAAAFAKMYPIGTELTVQELDDFIIKEMQVNAPSSTDKGSDGWQAFLQRRYQAKANLNKAASHPDIFSGYGVTPFFIRQNGQNQLSVVTPHDAATKTGENSVMHQLVTLTKTKQRSLRHLLQSIDFETLPMGEQVKVSMLAEHISDFETRINREIGDLDHKFNKVRSGILRLVSSGAVVPMNGGIKALTDLSGETDD